MKSIDLGKDKINKLLFMFSVPCIVSMLINSIYNIVDQIFIGQGVGYIGNAATNVIFPLVMLFTAVAQLIGNGSAATLSLKLGENNKEEAKKSVGSAVTVLVVSSILLGIAAYFLLPNIVSILGCTENVYESALSYGRIICLGAPFMMIYTGLSSFIRADGSPKYSMVCLLVGAIINLILDPIFIFTFNMGVEGGAYATIIGQLVSCGIAIFYLFRTKSIKLEKKDFKVTRSIFKVLGYGLSSFISLITVIVVFAVMNNVMTKYGANTQFGSDIPLSIYGIVSKINQLFYAMILGISCGAQPIIGFNYGAGKLDRVKETMKKVLQISFVVGLVFNLIVVLFPSQVVGIFGDGNGEIYTKFAKDCLRIYLLICTVNIIELCCSIMIQSIGNVKKAAIISITRQIIIFIPTVLLMANAFGLYGSLWAGPIVDFVSFIIIIVLFYNEYKKLDRNIIDKKVDDDSTSKHSNLTNKIVIVINREYGSGGRYVGKLLAEDLEIPFYDKELIHLAAKESGFNESFIESMEEKKVNYLKNPYYNEDDTIFVAEAKVIKKLAKDSCVIIGRCADYILEDKDVLRVFLYSSKNKKIERAVKYYGLDKKNAAKEIKKQDKIRERHYNYYTSKQWKNLENYDAAINVDLLGVEKTAEILKQIVIEK